MVLLCLGDVLLLVGLPISSVIQRSL